MIDDSQELMRTTLANSQAFQSLVGAANATEALTRVYGDQLPKPAVGTEHTLAELVALRPYAIVFIPSHHGWQIERDASGDSCWNSSGIVHCIIQRSVPEVDKDDHAKVDKDFRLIGGDIVSDLVGMAEEMQRLAMHKISVSGPYRTKNTELKSIGDAQAYEFMVEWGHR